MKEPIIEGKAVQIIASGTFISVGSDQYFVTNSNQLKAMKYLSEKLGLQTHSMSAHASDITSENIGQYVPTDFQFIYKFNT